MQPPQGTIPEALFATADRGEGEYVFHLEDGPVRLSCAELAERALRGARRLTALGVQPGDAVGVLGPNRPEWVVWAFAAWIAGAVLVPVQIPLRIRDPDAFREQLRSLVEAGGCRRVLAEPRLAGLLPSDVAVPWEEGGEESAEEPVAPQPRSSAVIQLTSGSTAAPKGALLTHVAVMAQMEILRRGYRYEDGVPRTVLSWTPFFHDLGLFANLVHPAVAGSSTHHLPTERFARDPAEWLRLVERTRVAGTIAPPSAFGSAMRAARRRGERADLSSLEAAYFAAEGVDPELAQRMVVSAREFGFRPEALGATYGLAEAVMAVSYPAVGAGLHVDRVSLRQLADSGVAAEADDGPTRLMISCGEPLMELRIAGPEGSLAERRVGEIQLRGPSLMSGYVGSGANDPFVDGWLRTGDLGYLAGGELYVAGRARDMMIVVGHNYYPEDFEWAAGRVAGVRPGRCVAFSSPGDEGIALLVEPLDPAADPAALAREVRGAVGDAVGVAPRRVVVLPRGAVEKTTSGKLRRAAMREAYAAGAIPPARVGAQLREHPVLVPTSVGPVAGIVTEPEARPRAALVILQGLGAPCRAGVNANWTRLARRLAELGLSVFRFDFSCEGDSMLAGRELEQGVGWRRSTDLGILRDVAPWFLERSGEPGFYVAGSCHGGRIALEFAATDRAALGLFLVTPYLWRREPLEQGEPDYDRIWANGPTLDTDADMVAGFRTVLDRAPVSILSGEGEAEDLLPFSRALERTGASFELEVVPGMPLHPVGHPEQQARVERWLPDRLAVAMAEREKAEVSVP